MKYVYYFDDDRVTEKYSLNLALQFLLPSAVIIKVLQMAHDILN